ncbi:MAG TPA: response regulator [Gemmatimonadales bacterium]|nr:response regulator [Gemmatimonadales bacterium]
MTRRILVIEDESALRRALERALRSFGYEAASAGDPRSAYALLSEGRFDALVLDIRLPHTLGDAFYFAVVRQWPELRGRIVLMSGDPWSGSETWPPELHGCPMLAKPFTLDTLARTLAAVFDDGSERRLTNGS